MRKRDDEIEQSPLKELCIRFLSPVRFFRTKQKVLQGCDMLMIAPDDIRKTYMGPWTFDIYESFLAAIPAMAVIWVMDLVFPLPISNHIKTTMQSIACELPAPKYMISTFCEAFRILNPLQMPMAFTISSVIVAWASAIGSGGGKRMRNRCRYTYLYLDGAYGLVAQALFVLGITLVYWLVFRSEPDEWFKYPLLPVYVFFWSLAALGFLWQACLTCYIIPARLFALTQAPGIQRHDPRSFWRLLRWLLYTLIAIPGVLLSFVIVNWFIFAISVLIGFVGGYLKYWISR